MFKDQFLLVGFAGLMGNLADEAGDWLAYLLKIDDSTTAHFISNIIYATNKLSPIQLVVGQFSHLISGAVLGIVPYLIYRWSGKRYPVIKGLGIGAGMWLNHVVLVPCFADQRIHILSSTASILVELVTIMLWGIVSFCIIARYGE